MTVMTRKRKTARMLACLFLLGSLQAGCAGEPAGEHGEDGKLSVVTTIFPQYDFTREIAGEQVDLKMLLKPGEETHSYEPTPQDIIAIQNSDIFIYVGGENDAWVEDILDSVEEDLVTLRLMDCVDTVEEEYVEGMKGAGGHSHEGGTEDHSVHEIDEHVWTSPENAALIVEQIRDILVREDPANRDVYEDNAKRYTEELAMLDGKFRDVVDHSQSNLLIFGDRFPFRYFADAYGLDYYAAFPGCASDTEPSAATMAFLIDKTREDKAPVVLKMELSSDNIANAVAEATGTKVMTFYSCHNLSAEDFENGETYVSLMERNVETLREALNGWH